MNFAALAQLLLGVATQAPALFQEAKDLYTSSRDSFSTTDQAALDAAYAKAVADDQASTDAAKAALDDAAKS